MPHHPDLPCSVCGTLLWRSNSSLPEGQATCRSCRKQRTAVARAEVLAYREKRRRERKPRPSATGRGYGYEHAKRRRELLPRFIGTDCAICGEVMTADQKLDVDHSTPLRVDPNSVADRVLHRSCNAGWNRKGQPTGFDYSPRPCAMCGTTYKPKLPQHATCSRACGTAYRMSRRAA